MPDTFRQYHIELNDEQKRIIQNLKAEAGGLELALDAVENSREKSIAMTKLEECIMWATKAATSK